MNRRVLTLAAGIALGVTATAAPVTRISFAWRPPLGAPLEYEMSEAADQHQLELTPGVEDGGEYPLVIALHGQPKRGQPPRSYQFKSTVTTVSRALVGREEVQPFVLALPVFRYMGTNWRGFDLALFRKEAERALAKRNIRVGATYVVGHSAAAGCGGDGMNRAHRLKPAAVGFFDTCVGPGFSVEVHALRKAKVPTLLVHGVETAGFRPRQPREYEPSFDFGRVYAPLGVAPVPCPQQLPDAPLRDQPYRCAADANGTVRAFVIDTGAGEPGHNAVIPVAFAFFLRQYLPVKRSAATD